MRKSKKAMNSNMNATDNGDGFGEYQNLIPQSYYEKNTSDDKMFTQINMKHS